MITKDAMYLCPKCSSQRVDYGSLVGAGASCRDCPWSGKAEELVGVPFAHLSGSPDTVFTELSSDLRRLMTDKGVVVPLAKFLDRWGFIELNGEKSLVSKQLARYAAAVTRGMLEAIIKERDLIAEEEHKNG